MLSQGHVVLSTLVVSAPVCRLPPIPVRYKPGETTDGEWLNRGKAFDSPAWHEASLTMKLLTKVWAADRHGVHPEVPRVQSLLLSVLLSGQFSAS